MGGVVGTGTGGDLGIIAANSQQTVTTQAQAQAQAQGQARARARTDVSPMQAFFDASQWDREDVRIVLSLYSAILLTLVVLRGGP